MKSEIKIRDGTNKRVNGGGSNENVEMRYIRNVDKDRSPTATEHRQAVQKMSDGISNIFTNLINKADT